jgi:hypothetical protein
VQRKTSDIVNFITDHAQVMHKMLQWTPSPYLLTIGQYTEGEGKLVWNGKHVGGGDRGWSYWAYQGALRAWQRQGGFVVNLSRDGLFMEWYQHMLKSIAKDTTETYISPRKPSQQVIAVVDESTDDGYTRGACISALSTISGISIGKAIKITDYCGSLAQALVFLSDPDHLALKRSDPTWPEGIANTAFANTIKWLGLKSGGEGEAQWREVVEITTRQVGKGG